MPAPLLKSLLDERDDNGRLVSDPIIARALSALWNRCLVQRCVPHAWKLSHFTLLPKNDKGRAGDPAAMRPLAVASILYCGLMWLLARRLLGPTSDILPDSQRGFRAGASCLDVLEIVDTMLWDHRRTQRPYALLQLDLAKAYNSIRHQALLDTWRTSVCRWHSPNS